MLITPQAPTESDHESRQINAFEEQSLGLGLGLKTDGSSRTKIGVPRPMSSVGRSRRGYVGVHETRVRRASDARVSCYQVCYSPVIPAFPAAPVSRDINGVGEIAFDLPGGRLAIGRERLTRDQGVALARDGREGRGTLGGAFLQVDTRKARL